MSDRASMDDPRIQGAFDAGLERGRAIERQRIRQALAIRLREVVTESAYLDLLEDPDVV